MLITVSYTKTYNRYLSPLDFAHIIVRYFGLKICSCSFWIDIKGVLNDYFYILNSYYGVGYYIICVYSTVSCVSLISHVSIQNFILHNFVLEITRLNSNFWLLMESDWKICLFSEDQRVEEMPQFLWHVEDCSHEGTCQEFATYIINIHIINILE